MNKIFKVGLALGIAILLGVLSFSDDVQARCTPDSLCEESEVLPFYPTGAEGGCACELENSLCAPCEVQQCSGPNDCPGADCCGGECGSCTYCQASAYCPRGEDWYTDWSRSVVTEGCAKWGQVCGDAVRRGGNRDCCGEACAPIRAGGECCKCGDDPSGQCAEAKVSSVVYASCVYCPGTYEKIYSSTPEGGCVYPDFGDSCYPGDNYVENRSVCPRRIENGCNPKYEDCARANGGLCYPQIDFICDSDCTTPVVTATRTNSTSASVSWTGSGASYSFFMGVDETTVTSECPNGTSGSGPSFCNYAETAITPPFAAAGLTPDTTYYIKVVDNSGSCESLVTPYLSSCLAPPLFLTEGGPSDDLYVFETGSVAQKVTSATFSKTDTQGTNVTSITSPDNTTANGISSTVTPLNPGTSLVDYDVFFSSTLACSDSSQVRVSPPSAWWQVIDSDVMSYSAIGSSVPTSDDFFGLPGIGGYPGVPAAPSLSFGNGSASENFNWQAQTGVSAQRIFNYDYFDGIKPSDITLNDFALGIEGGGIITGDYYWFKNTGPLVLPATNIASRKVVLFVDGDLNITGDISLTDAFLMIIVSGNVTINPDVASLEGLFVANGTISTGTNGAGADAVPGLYVRGALASYGGLSLDRDLVDNSGPAHQFEYAPDLILLFPRELSNRKINWKEVAP